MKPNVGGFLLKPTSFNIYSVESFVGLRSAQPNLRALYRYRVLLRPDLLDLVKL